MENCNFSLFAAKGKWKWQTSNWLLQMETENRSLFSLVDDCCFSKHAHLCILESAVLPVKHSNMAINVAAGKNLGASKGPQVAVNFGEGGSEGLPRSGNTVRS